MALVSKNIPNLINGVSQQPAALRLESQGEVQENGFSDVVDGLKKRPPTKFLKKLHTGSPNGNTFLTETELASAFFHTYKRSDEEQFQVIVTSVPVAGYTPTVTSSTTGSHSSFNSISGAYTRSLSVTAPSASTNQQSQTVQINITSLPTGGATYSIGRTNAGNQWFFSGGIALTMGLNTITVPAVSFDRYVKLRFSSDDIHFSTLTLNGTFIYQAPTPDLSGAYTKNMYVYDIDGNLRYQSGVASWSKDGVQIQANTDSLTYLPNLASNLTATSVADSTFIVNKTQNVEAATAQGVLTRNERSALVYCKSVNYGRTYTLDVTSKINSNNQNQSISIPNQVTNQAGNGQVNDNVLKVSTVIVDADRLDSNPPNEFGLRHIDNHANLSVEPSTYGEEPYFIVNADATFGDFDIKVTDDDGGVNLKAFKGSAKSFTDLPNQCEDGYILGVVGDNQKKEDDFYVKFEGTGGSGFWRECAAPNINHGFNLSTMPHQLRQNANHSFSFGQGVWDDRKCGDNNTNSFPSFCDPNSPKPISDIFFHRNRLGVLSGENVIFSEASGYYNFFRTTVRTLLDSDPIDVAVSQNEVSELKAAVPIQDNLLLFSSLNQFTLSATQLLTPAEVTIDQSTKYECDLTASPVGAGNSVFFATKSGSYAGMREFFTRDDTEIKDAPEITSHVPSYIKINNGIREIKASANEDMLILLSDINKNECYIYKWYNSDTERLQSSWSKWTFHKGVSNTTNPVAKNIASVSFNNADIYFTFEDGSYEKMELAEIAAPTLLDSQQTVTSPSEFSNISGDLTNRSVAITEEGLVLTGFETSINVAKANEYINTGKSLVIGEPYTFKYQLSEQVFKPVQGDSTKLARFQLRKLAFDYSNTGSFKVTVDSVGRDPTVSTFTGRLLGQEDNILGTATVVPEGSFPVGIQSQADKTKITITNDTHLPSVFQSAEWEGFVVLRNKRL